MVDLKNVSLLELQCGYMKEDKTTKALCAAINPLLRELGNQVDYVVLYPKIDKLSGAVLDELAWGLHVDGYNSLADDVEKRRMIKNSYQIHKFKGTAFSVRKIVESVFGDAGSIEEWFDYGGQPYHFRIDVYCKNKGVTAVDQFRALQLVNSGKNLRSELDGLRLQIFQKVSLPVGSVSTVGQFLEVFPIGDIDTHNIKTAATLSQTNIVSV